MLATAGLAALAINSGTAVAGNGDKVTGGGQILLGTDPEKAGNTIAFTAQGTVDAAKGRVTFIDRSGGTGQAQEKFHGIVDCIEVTDNYGIVGGYRRGDEGDRFDLRVVDNGEPGAGFDMIAFDLDNPDVECGDEEADNEEPEMALGRGNVQVRDGDDSNPPAEESQEASPLSLLGF
jgi:hypothetical protein